MADEAARCFESDLVALADPLREDETFADELYCALCNADWRRDDGSEWSGSWRYSAGLVADLRELGECYLDFYCSASGAEGTISQRVAIAMAELGWHGTGYGKQLWLIGLATGERKVWSDGEWVDPDDENG
ncbi:MAG: hypothetical protein QOJ25_1111 [Solirubrobacteraceae bacterium]|jgi:hypothetical protein|nr:hypothetical protein [Solirubrobacteraceae bacterium]